MLKLGKRPARHAISFRFGDFFNAARLPAPPLRFGHYQQISSWGMLANDQYGDCVWAGAAHETMVWSLEGGRQMSRFIPRNVLSDYSTATGFDPARPETDQGTDMKEAAAYRKRTGVVDASGMRHKIDAYVALKVGNVDQLMLATYLLGAAGVGLQMSQQAMDAFDDAEPWDVMPKPDVVGGHYVPCVGRNSKGNLLVVTWGRLHAMTPAFYERFSDEAVAYVSLEVLNEKNLSPEGFDAAGLHSALAALQ